MIVETESGKGPVMLCDRNYVRRGVDVKSIHGICIQGCI